MTISGAVASLGWGFDTACYALEEARRNLARKFSEFLDGLDALSEGVRLVEGPVGHAFPPGLAQKDRPIFQAAVGCRATHLLTGDLKDFGPLMNRPEDTSGIHVLTVADFLDHLGRRQA